MERWKEVAFPSIAGSDKWPKIDHDRSHAPASRMIAQITGLNDALLETLWVKYKLFQHVFSFATMNKIKLKLVQLDKSLQDISIESCFFCPRDVVSFKLKEGLTIHHLSYLYETYVSISFQETVV